MNRIADIAVLVVFAAAASATASAPLPFTLATDGKSTTMITVGEKASQPTREAAETLARYLTRIAEAEFHVVTGDGQQGLAVGVPNDFPDLPFAAKWSAPAPTEREDYLLKSHARGVYLIGASEQAVVHAVWDLLYRLGHRQFFPGERWEVVPTIRKPVIAVDVRESPDYHARRIWYGFGAWDYAAEPYRNWCERNRATSGIQLQTGHAYGGIIRGLQDDFAQHPEFYALVDGKRDARGQAKLCIGNADLRARIAAYAIQRVKTDPTVDSVSMDPSDGGGWCECEACAAVGSITDRALLLANEVADGLQAEFPGKCVGMYAYNYHSPPPNIKPHPQVVVSIATAFLKGGLTLDEIILGWSRHGTTLGIREYYSVNTWDRDMPAKARGGNIEYLARTIPEFHSQGVRFMSAESSDNWGPNGLGYYLAARMLWDTSEASRIDTLTDDFLTRAFGPAKEPLADFYRQLDGSQPHLVFDDQLGRMFHALTQGRQLADTPAIRNRIDDLVLYAHYVDLYHQYQQARGQDRQAAFEALIRHAYRIRTTMLVHTKALYRDLANRDKSVAIPVDAEWNVPEPKNPWKSSQPFTAAELTAYLEQGTARYPITELDFQPIAFSDNLAPAASLGLAAVPPGETGPGREQQTYYTFVNQLPATIELQITGGLIAHYRDRGNVRVELWKIGGESDSGERETLIASDRSVPPEGVQRTVRLKAKEIGLHKITIHDGKDRTRVTWPAGQWMTIESSVASPLNAHYANWSLYFYVPRGTKVVGLHGGGRGQLRDATNKVIFDLAGRNPNYHSVPVPAGQDGQLWKIHGGYGPIRLLTVPPYYARSVEELLLPTEVMEADNN